MPSPPAYVRCDPNVSAKVSTTTCEFATNAFYERWRVGGTAPVEVYSPAAGKFFATTCISRSGRVTCSTTDGGSVRFPQRAVDEYTEAAAAAYARDHDVTPPAGAPSVEASPEASAPEPSQECDPNYEGACLDPDASDYDCGGGSGDGPSYTGPVHVVGVDRHGLDADGDGYACE